MALVSLLLLALALSMDATAVAMTRGFTVQRFRPRDALLISGLFGLFQAGMPLIGWAAGARFSAYVQAWDHWLAFGLLALIGGKMIKEGIGGEDHDQRPAADPFALKPLLVLSVATSIDALAAGVTLPMMNVPPGPAVALIGLTTFLLSLGGIYVGRSFGDRLGGKLDVIGGVVLIGIGVKILIEHLLG